MHGDGRMGESLAILKQIVNIPKEDMDNVYTCNGFLLRARKFEKAHSKTFFHKFTQ
jgi:hypothetical protein